MVLNLLTNFAALSLCGTVVLSLLPEGGMKRTAGMAVGLLTLLCWAEGVAALLGLDFTLEAPATALAPTSVSVAEASAQAAATLSSQWEENP